ncbi:restriction endonuclease subunit S [Rheinheimera sp. F8]|uniref:restriction endonuclease subunit S n=1 Tax=Rheinheimera sp. F8 TaxID=1763998 RepID=UPI0007449C59|nr:restriction endonuclease subunit S [Rheinheimera sp. F8]ALZ77326.1 hypothetical protein ATY27_17225 [Rheinheimera sp. F8]
MSEVLFDLPEGWSWQPLSALAEIVSGGTPSREVAEYWSPAEIAWVTPTDITGSDGRYLTSSKESISSSGLQKSSASMLPIGTVLMTSRATLGQAKISAVKCCTNQGFKSLVPKESVPSEYLYYLVQLFKDRYERLGIGSTFLEVSKKDTEKFLLPVAPKGQRASISKILVCIDNQIDATQAIIDKYTAIKQGMMADLFSRGIDPQTKALRPTFKEAPELYHKTPLGMLPKGWMISQLEAIAPVIDPQPDHRTPPQVTDGVPYVGVGDFTWDERIDAKKCRKVSPDAYLKQQSRFKVELGDVIFGKIGTIGQPKVIREAGNFALSANVLLIKSGIIGHYIRDVLISEYTLAQLDRIVNVTSQPAVGIQTMRELMIPIPDAIELALINSKLQFLENYIWSEVSSLNKLKAQKNGLMHDLLTGKVPVLA